MFTLLILTVGHECLQLTHVPLYTTMFRAVKHFHERFIAEEHTSARLDLGFLSPFKKTTHN